MANITGTEGNDLLNGTPEGDRILGLAGNDTLIGFAGDDWLSGNLDDDLIYGNQGNDTAYGGRGQDIIYGGRGIDWLFGNLGNDVLHGNRDDDILYGGKGNDTVRGGKGNDRIFGDRGNDILYGDLGSNTLTGGEGSDIFVLSRDGGDFFTDFDPQEDRIGLDGINFNDLSIHQGTGDRANDTIIRDRQSGTVLAILQNVDANDLDSDKFVEDLPEIDLGILSGTRSLQDRVDDSNPIDVYKFDLAVPTSFSVRLDGLSADADLLLAQDLNNNGELEANEILFVSAEGGTTPEVKENYVLANGTYYLLVEQYEGDTDYTLTLDAVPFLRGPDRAGNSLATATDLGVLVNELSFNDWIGNGDPSDYYRFSISQATSFTMYLSALIADADVELIQDRNNNGIVDEGEVLGRSEEAGTDPEYVAVARLAPGTYYVRVLEFEGETPYQLDLLASRDSAIATEIYPTIDTNQTIQGALESSDEANPLRLGTRKDEYQLTDAIAGQVITVNLNSTEFDTYLQIFNTNTGEIIAENDDIAEGNTNSSASFVVQPNVDYGVRVTSFAPQDAGRGQYTLTTQASNPIVGTLRANNTVANEVVQRRAKCYRFARSW
uniref:Pre-peptidase C-terminal domain-containing protein n=1 Tax=Desertifilum tharense IPPAS B-1220 TaxID=1781255 RepID=A0ACD5GXI1_9CYAN